MYKSSLYQLKNMEYQPQQTQTHIIARIPLFNFPTILDFLDLQTIDTIYQTIKTITQNSNSFFSFLFVKRFIDKYLNATDRSAYINFYSEATFLEIEKEHIRSLSIFYESNYSQIDKTFQDVKKFLGKQLSFMESQQEVVQSLFLNITDPLIPFPKMRKEHIGIHCNSGFQFYLIQRRFPSIEQDFVQECFQKMKQSLQQLKLSYCSKQNSQKNNSLQQENKTKNLSQENKQKIKYLMKHWYRIDSTNYKEKIIQQDSFPAKIHNSIILVIVLIDNLIQSYDCYIDSIVDPFHQFAEFNMRYCMFRNIVLSLETQLSSLFQSYNEFYTKYLKSVEEMIDQQNILQGVENSHEDIFIDITFWHCAFSKWYLHMKRRHDDLTNMYCYLLKKINLNRIKQLIQQKEQLITKVDNFKPSHEQHQIVLQNRISIQYEQLLNRQEFKFDSPIIDLVQEYNMTHQLIKEYTEYMVDISINQDSVHWCGHSDHEMHIPYRDYEQKVISHFMEYLERIFSMCQQIDNKNILFCQILTTIFNQIDKEYLKPVTLKKIIKKVNQSWGYLVKQPNLKISNQSTSSLSSTSSTNLLNTSNQSGYLQNMECQQVSQIIQLNFSDQDKKLQYYNNKSGITTKFDYAYNILIETDDFYNSMKKSTETNCTNGNSTEQKCKTISMDRSLSFSEQI